jgi:D-glycerate 3-kinase
MSPTDMRSLATSGPAFPILSAAGAVDWLAWERAATRLEAELSSEPTRGRRIHHLYVPVLLWLARAARLAARQPSIAGVSAPQGAGKSTLVHHLLPLLADLGLRAVAVSIDDFYLDHAAQERLAAAHPANPYLRYRGYPGTHDLPLGAATLEALRGLSGAGEVRVPVYDKSMHGGRGDRLPEAAWRSIKGPLDLVLVEGWMLGFRPIETYRPEDASLREINERLAAYEAWFRLLDCMVILQATDSRHVLRWRVEAEETMRAEGKPGLDRAAIEDYVRRFLPAYDLYATTVATGRWAPDRQLVISLDEDRLAVNVT